MISYNATLYNGEEEELSIAAKKMMEKIRMELKKHYNNAGDKKQVVKEEHKITIYANPRIAGKLTAPPTFSMISSME